MYGIIITLVFFTIVIVFILGRLTPSSFRVTVTTNQPSATLSCELYGYLPEQLPTIVWTFDDSQLTDDSVFTIMTGDGSHMIQNGGNTHQASVRSVLTINRPNMTHERTYVCSADGDSRNITLQMMESDGELQGIIGLDHQARVLYRI